MEALLRLFIVDSACGSGHLLCGGAAARGPRGSSSGEWDAVSGGVPPRVAAGGGALHLRGGPEPDGGRAVQGRAVDGEVVEPGLPLTFLKSHILHGNALLGTTPELMEKGIPGCGVGAYRGG